MEYIQTVKNFVIENFLFGDDNGLEENSSFLENGVVDSTGILELVNFLEETYEIEVEDEELIPGNLDSINNVVNYLKRKRNGRRADS